MPRPRMKIVDIVILSGLVVNAVVIILILYFFVI